MERNVNKAQSDWVDIFWLNFSNWCHCVLISNDVPTSQTTVWTATTAADTHRFPLFRPFSSTDVRRVWRSAWVCALGCVWVRNITYFVFVRNPLHGRLTKRSKSQDRYNTFRSVTSATHQLHSWRMKTRGTGWLSGPRTRLSTDSDGDRLSDLYSSRNGALLESATFVFFSGIGEW